MMYNDNAMKKTTLIATLFLREVGIDLIKLRARDKSKIQVVLHQDTSSSRQGKPFKRQILKIKYGIGQLKCISTRRIFFL